MSFAFFALSASHLLTANINEPMAIPKAAPTYKYIEILTAHFLIIKTTCPVQPQFIQRNPAPSIQFFTFSSMSPSVLQSP
ncbi:MAG: hypothetical protein LBU14_01060 [Candidatus Peribacteria bacterium]|jgi:hypothetical protein|nr:hypothetical protein [Candidatus Peribacteria bacterium]